jgi:hypothetical protein
MLSGMGASLRAFVLGRLLRSLAVGLYAAAVILVPLGLSAPDEPVTPEPLAPLAQGRSAPSLADASEPRALSGIWWRYEAGLSGDPVRFYYFHGDGTGLYRYGKVGLTNTHSFDYDVVGERLVLDFRKSGEHHEVPFTLQPGRARGEGRDWLELHDDPREPGSTRYFRESEAIVRQGAGASAELGPPPAGHLWIDLQEHATGGRGFVMYQLRAAGIDGRGVGWFHRGDFDDWSTEALGYRIAGDRLELVFSLAGRVEVTAFTVETAADGTRWLALADDPRDYWHPHRYMDAGPSFGAALAPFELALFH